MSSFKQSLCCTSVNCNYIFYVAGVRRSALLHSFSTNDASLGEYKYTVTVGNQSIKITGTNLDLVRVGIQQIENHVMNKVLYLCSYIQYKHILQNENPVIYHFNTVHSSIFSVHPSVYVSNSAVVSLMRCISCFSCASVFFYVSCQSTCCDSVLHSKHQHQVIPVLV